jgi:hypothetical protein
MDKPKLKLSGEDGNAFFIMGRAASAGKKFGWTTAQIKEVLDEAKEGDYNNLLRTMMKHFDCS